LEARDVILRRTSLPYVLLVCGSSKLLFEPVNEVLEGEVVLVVEEVASGLYFYILLHHLVLRNVSKDYILWVLFKDSELVWDSCSILLFLLL
jgi:hypothetical protein